MVSSTVNQSLSMDWKIGLYYNTKYYWFSQWSSSSSSSSALVSLLLNIGLTQFLLQLPILSYRLTCFSCKFFYVISQSSIGLFKKLLLLLYGHQSVKLLVYLLSSPFICLFMAHGCVILALAGLGRRIHVFGIIVKWTQLSQLAYRFYLPIY